MNIKSQSRLLRISQMKELIEANPGKETSWIVLKAQCEFGFSERLAREYVKLVEFANEN